MKVLLFTTEFPPFAGGAGIYTADLAEGLSRQGVDVKILAPLYNDVDSDWDKNQNYTILRDFKMPLNLIKRCFTLVKHIIKEKPQIVHSTNSGAHWVSALTSLFIPFKSFITMHGSEVYTFFEKPSKKSFKWIIRHVIVRRYFNKSFKIICISNYSKELLKSYKILNKEESLEVVHNGVNLRKFVSRNNDAAKKEIKNKYNLNDHCVLLSVSRLVYDKGNDLVLKALPKVKEHYPKIKYLVVGDGEYKEELQRITRELNLVDNIHFVGKIDQNNLSSFYHACDIFIMPSRREGLGLVFIEAYLHKKPVIGSNCGGIPEVIRDGKSGYIVNFNTEEIADTIIELLADDKKAKEMGSEGYKIALEKFNSDRMAQEVISNYESYNRH